MLIASLGCGDHTDVVAVLVGAEQWGEAPAAMADAGAGALRSVLVRARPVPAGWPFDTVPWPLPTPLAEAFGAGDNVIVRFEGRDAQALVELGAPPEGTGRPVAFVDASGTTLLLTIRIERS